ncbi:atp15p [Saccharomyces arboricola H-6]|uniref:Atp15p n=1 Tax=Saccharomyces arboricola (strain H-6 / AS 2.3317 / CBS 10644) TaxID=1160507 RepID=J8Q1I0_SACAR|nr:atp15p [Saccharomyces arboricola H-6]
MSAWRKAGVSYAAYLNVAAKTIRSSLKTELQTANVISRSKTDAFYTKYKNGTAASDPTPITR